MSDIPPFDNTENTPTSTRVRGKLKHSASINRLTQKIAKYDVVDAGVTSPSETRTQKLSDHESFYYKMTHPRRGKFLILNHETYQIDIPRRDGTNKDRDNLYKTMTDLGFEVHVENNLTKKQIAATIVSYCNEDHQLSDCFGCAILTHGHKDDSMDKEFLYASDQLYELSLIIDPLKSCLSLHGKPKLIFIQACRGKTLTEPRPVQHDCVDAGVDNAPSSVCTLPIEADFFISYSTVKGHYAWRNGEEGSWFIQALCYALKWFGREIEFLHIMTRVNNMVAYDWESNCKGSSDSNKKKQMPSFVSRLIGEIRFNDVKQQGVQTIQESFTNTHEKKTYTTQASSDSVFAESTPPNDLNNQEELKQKLLLKQLELVELEKKYIQMKIENFFSKNKNFNG